MDRLDGPLKVRGAATYAFEWPVDDPAYLYPLQAEIAAGRVTGIDAGDASAGRGRARRAHARERARARDAGDAEIAVLQSDEVAFRGQLRRRRDRRDRRDRPRRRRPGPRRLRAARRTTSSCGPTPTTSRKPENAAFFGAGGGELQNGEPADTELGDVDGALASAAVELDATYTTPMHHHNPMEPHAAIAVWDGTTG